MNKILRKLKEVGILNLIIGIIKIPYFKLLQKFFHFESWHISPYELREYVQIVAKYVNSHNAKYVVDIGCGLGELIRHINAPKRIGIDIEKENINTAKYLHRRTNIEFKNGSFDDLGTKQEIDYLITLNFMHGSPHQTWQPAYHKICKNNNIKHIIVDSTKPDDNSYFHDFSLILPSEYKKCDQFGPLLGGRYIWVYEKE